MVMTVGKECETAAIRVGAVVGLIRTMRTPGAVEALARAVESGLARPAASGSERRSRTSEVFESMAATAESACVPDRFHDGRLVVKNRLTEALQRVRLALEEAMHPLLVVAKAAVPALQDALQNQDRAQQYEPVRPVL